MKRADMITLATDNGILITFDTGLNCPSTFGLMGEYKGTECKYENCKSCWEKAIEQIENISTVIYYKKEI